jgi:hypothetical protein
MITLYSFISDGYDIPRTTGKIFNEKDVSLFVDPTRNAREVKILSHLFINDEWSLWTDGTIELKKSPGEILEKYKDRGDIITFKHRFRNCTYDEGTAVLAGHRDRNVAIVNEQMEYYHKEGYPEQNGQFETGVLLRHHTPEVKRFNEFWWSQICRFSKRDQLSVNYTAWKLGTKVGLFNGDLDNSEDFVIHPHQPNSSLL